MPRIKLEIEYDGTGFVGWQKQENGVSVQNLIENALLKAIGQRVNLYVAGRTDAGVHAIKQVAHFDYKATKKLEIKNQDIEIKSNFTKSEYINVVEKAKNYIFSGDIFQVVPSQRFHCNYMLDAKSLYRSLRRLNPSPFLVNLNLPFVIA